MDDDPIAVAGVSYSFGTGNLQKQILYDVSTTVAAGEIVILTGPSGSGKSTLLTLMGALRAAQEGSIRVLGRELRRAGETTLASVRRQIGFIFQQHNLIDALTVGQNVAMGLHRSLGLSRAAARKRVLQLLDSVGLAEHVGNYPDQLSGGQKQRVAIARALAATPRIVLADEPTASLDKASGRDVVDRLQALAKQDRTAVVLVTHDNRILDVADRIVYLEEGRLSSFSDAVRANTQRLLSTLAKSNRGEEVARQIAAMEPNQFTKLLQDLTAEARQLLEVMTLGTDEAFATMMARMLHVLAVKVGQILDADRVSILLADDSAAELYSVVAQTDDGRPLEIRIPASHGVAGRAYRTGKPVNVPDAYASPFFDRAIDQRTGYHTRSILCVPITDESGRPFAVMSLLNKRTGAPFDQNDERALQNLVVQVGVIVRTWHEAHRARTARMTQSMRPS